ncbi:MAG: VOC family protein [Steroidobacteraceae bacterium]
MNNNPVIWFEIYVQDMPRAKAFYEQVLATTLTKLPGSEMEMWGFPSEMSKPGCSGTLVKMAGVPSGGSTLVYFHSEDCSIEEARFAKAGGKVFRPKMSIGQYGFITIGVDTEGNMFGLHSLK